MGKAYIVGAGLGNVDHLTVKAQQLLAEAEVLIYDALVDAQLLQLVTTSCQKFYVGKRGGQPSTPQAEINRLLVEHCLLGKQVVRLKSGDPLIFGRTSSEIQALIAAGCAFEVVPGISAALAAPLLAGIPLTDTVMSRCFAVVSAHEPADLDWEALARIDTLSILMGGRQLGEIVDQLQRHGLTDSCPIAVIRAAGTDQQQVWSGTLADIVKQTAGISLSPAVIVVGEVVGLRNYFQPEFRSQNSGVTMIPQASKTKTGKTVLITRSEGQSSQFTQLLQQQGANVIEMPALVITPPSSWAQLDQAIAYLSDFDWLILTSTNGVDYFLARLFSQGKDTRALAGVKIAVVGKKTAASLQSHGLQADFIPPDFVADSLIAHFPEPLSEKKILFPRVETGGRDILVKDLTIQGAEVVEVAAYQSGCPAEISPVALAALQQRKVDIITFASAKTVQNFYQLLTTALGKDATLDSLLEGVCIASIGPQTSASCRKLLGRVDVEAQEYTLEGLVQAITLKDYTFHDD
jgi:uroporphyrinogen III methyltransferase/synthase